MKFTLNQRQKYDDRQKLSKAEAIAEGVPVYWTGKPCQNGHVAHRYVGNRICVECSKAATRTANVARRVQAAKKVGIDPDLRRRAEALREQRELEKELEG